MYFKGEYVAQDLRKGFDLLIDAAAYENDERAVWVGFCYEFGVDNEIKPDYGKMLYWFEIAAKNGNEFAKERLKAEKGDAQAQFNVAYCLRTKYPYIEEAKNGTRKLLHRDIEKLKHTWNI